MTDGTTQTDRATLDSQAEITLGLLTAVHANSTITQRSIASELGIALGLANAYLKRCVRKGYVKVSQIPSNRYAYYLTPQGFAEKTRLTAEYLSSSFQFFRRARGQCEAALADCDAKGWHRVALAGAGDLAEIAALCGLESPVDILAILDPGATRAALAGLPVVAAIAELPPVDAVLVTDLRHAQATYESLRGRFAEERLFTPALLGVARSGRPGVRR
ncbi:MAG: winged helix-turn-helix transcriptional regulator [Alphaproteobacteria bacterium]